MLPSLGFQEIVVLAILALVVVGPKDLPLLLRKIGRWTARLRGMANEFRSGFDELARQAELDELRKEVNALRSHTGFNDIQREFNAPLDSPLDASFTETAPPPAAISHDVAHAAPIQPQLEALPAPESEAFAEAASDAALEADAPVADASPLRSVS